MVDILNYTMEHFEKDIDYLAQLLPNLLPNYSTIVPVLRGGAIVAMAISHKTGIPIKTMTVEEARTAKSSGEILLVVDDIVDTGTTRQRWEGFDFACLHVSEQALAEITTQPTYYSTIKKPGQWIVYWWEMQDKSPIEDSVIRLLEFIGEDPKREGLRDTPRRVANAYREIFCGYGRNASEVVTTFDKEHYNQMILLKDISMYSMCEHHMLPFFGKAHVAYIPREKIIGVSKLARIVEIFSRRLQIQERLGDQVTKALEETINPIGAACIIQADHLCMRMRGVQQQNSVMVTSSLRGVFLEESQKGMAAREELMRLIK